MDAKWEEEESQVSKSKVKGQWSLGKGKKKPLLQGSAVSLRLHETEDAIEELF
jgi:hypothetical protein